MDLLSVPPPQLNNLHFLLSGCHKVEVGDTEKGYLDWSSSKSKPFIELNYARIWCIEKGEGYVLTKTGPVHLTEGNTYLILPDSIISTSCENYMSQFYLQFSIEGLPLKLEDLFDLQLVIPNSSIIFSLLSLIQLKIKDYKTSSSANLAIHGALLMLLSCFTVSLKHTSPKHEIFSKVIEYIDSHYNQKITLEDLTHLTHYSKEYFSMLFKETYKVTVMSYLEKKRIQNAQSLLTTTDMTINEIANSCGYDDSLYFSRVFKKHTYLSPSAYRKKALSALY